MLLEAFTFLFESDASSLDDGLTESERKVKQLRDGLEKIDKGAAKLGDSLKKMVLQLGGAALAATSLGAMTQALFNAADAADKLGEAANSRGLDPETLSAWGGAATIAGGSVEGLIGSLDSLDTSLTQIDVTGKSRVAPFLKELGIDLDSTAYKGKSAMELLLPLADSFEKLSAQQQIGMGKKLGLDQGTIMLLQQGRREIELQIAKQRELGTVTKAQAEISAKFNDQQDYTAMAWRGVWLAVAEKVLPALTWVSAAFEKLGTFMRKHAGFMTGLVIALGAALLYFVLPPLISIATAAVIAFAPFYLIGALVAGIAAAFALLYEDIMVFLEGGDSLIGKLLERFPLLGLIIKGVGTVISDVWDGIKFAGEAVLFVLNAIIDGVLAAIEGIGEAVGWLLDAGNAVAKFFGFGNDEEEQTAKPEENANQGGNPRAASRTRQGVATAQNALATAGASPLASQSSSSISNSARTNNSNMQIDNLVVQTQATDANGISKAIGGSLQTQMRQAVNNYDDGVAA